MFKMSVAINAKPIELSLFVVQDQMTYGMERLLFASISDKCKYVPQIEDFLSN